MARILIFAALLAAGCGGPEDPGEAGTTMQEADLNTIGRQLGLEFPESCRVLGYGSEEGMDQAWRLKLECESADAAAVLAAPPFEGLELADSERYLFGPNEDWWDPETPAELPTGQVELSAARFLNIGAAPAGGGRTALYLMWHTT